MISTGNNWVDTNIDCTDIGYNVWPQDFQRLIHASIIDFRFDLKNGWRAISVEQYFNDTIRKILINHNYGRVGNPIQPLSIKSIHTSFYYNTQHYQYAFDIKKINAIDVFCINNHLSNNYAYVSNKRSGLLTLNDVVF